MRAFKQKHGHSISLWETHNEAVMAMNCAAIRESLDELFDGNANLEETPAGTKRGLFAHLEACRDCCRAFDVRARFRPAGRRRIY